MSTVVFLTTASTSPWTCPAGVTSVKIECVGAGSPGVYTPGTTVPFPTPGVAAGGAGGDYAANPSVTVVPSDTYNFSVGNGTVAGDTWFGGTSATTASVCAPGGSSNTTPIGVTVYDGGVAALDLSGISGPGGGAAGPNGAGNAGTVGGTGGSADAGFGGAGGSALGGNGGNGTEWSPSYGCGGGAGALATGSTWGEPGYYGGGGAAAGNGALIGGSSNGANGLIVITYTALYNQLANVTSTQSIKSVKQSRKYILATNFEIAFSTKAISRKLNVASPSVQTILKLPAKVIRATNTQASSVAKFIRLTLVITNTQIVTTSKAASRLFKVAQIEAVEAITNLFHYVIKSVSQTESVIAVKAITKSSAISTNESPFIIYSASRTITVLSTEAINAIKSINKTLATAQSQVISVFQSTVKFFKALNAESVSALYGHALRANVLSSSAEAVGVAKGRFITVSTQNAEQISQQLANSLSTNIENLESISLSQSSARALSIQSGESVNNVNSVEKLFDIVQSQLAFVLRTIGLHEGSTGAQTSSQVHARTAYVGQQNVINIEHTQVLWDISKFFSVAQSQSISALRFIGKLISSAQAQVYYTALLLRKSFGTVNAEVTGAFQQRVKLQSASTQNPNFAEVTIGLVEKAISIPITQTINLVRGITSFLSANNTEAASFTKSLSKLLSITNAQSISLYSLFSIVVQIISNEIINTNMVTYIRRRMAIFMRRNPSPHD